MRTSVGGETDLRGGIGVWNLYHTIQPLRNDCELRFFGLLWVEYGRARLLPS